MGSCYQPHDIEKRAFNLAREVVRFCQRLERAGPVSRSMAVQLSKAAASVGANLEEAAAWQSRADFIAKSTIALKEARETLFWLRLISETSGSAQASAAGPLLDEARQIVSILTAIVRNARSRR